MVEISKAELVNIGRKVADHFPALGKIDEVDVRAGQDSTEQPAYDFTFVVEPQAARGDVSHERIRLIQIFGTSLPTEGMKDTLTSSS